MLDAREEGLHRQLGATQVAMVAVGGSIGTGLLLGSGASVKIAGPGVVVSYLIGAALAFAVTMALGELASVQPAAGSFGVYLERYLNRWAGFVSRWGYWLSTVLSVGADLIAAATFMRLWFPGVPPLVWVLVFGAGLVAMNLAEVRLFANVESWLAVTKVLAIAAFVVLGAALLFSGRLPQHYTADGGFFPRGALAPLLAVSFALYSFLGVEFAAVSSGEVRSGSEMPAAVRRMFILLALVYVGGSLVLVGVMPWNAAGLGESPFVAVLRYAGVPAAAHIMNAVVLIAALSTANAVIYVSARMLFSLARGGLAPAALGRLTRTGSPRNALLASTIGIAAAIVLERWGSGAAYLYLIGFGLAGGMFSWIAILVAHIASRRRLTRDEVARLPMRAPGGAVASALALAGVLAAILATWRVPESRVTVVSGVALVAALSAIYRLSVARSR
jgi:L-asparagine transporter-like permease